MRREARALKSKAVASLRLAAQAFNGLDDDGRVTTVLLHTQHAFEMLLKAALVERGYRVFDPNTGRSIGFGRVLNMARQELALTAEVVGTLRAVDAMRDDEQHYLGGVSEAILYVHVRASVTIFDDVLNAVFTERLADLLPTRVLPISTEPPEDLDLLIDSQYRQIAELLQPGRRQRSEARMAIRTLLALEGHVAEQVGVSERDVTRVERDVRAGHARDQVFPRLRGLGTEVQGTGLSVKVRFTRNQDAPPVRFVEANETLQAGAIREVDLQNTYKHGAQALADKLRIGTGRAKALRWHLGIDGDPVCRHDFVFDRTTRRRYSDIALEKMRESIDGGVDLDAIRAQYLTATRH